MNRLQKRINHLTQEALAFPYTTNYFYTSNYPLGIKVRAYTGNYRRTRKLIKRKLEQCSFEAIMQGYFLPF